MGIFRRSITGIDIGNRVIKIAFCKNFEKKPSVIKAIKIDLPEHINIEEDFDFCIETIRRVGINNKIPFKNTALVALDNWYESFLINFPKMPNKDLINAITYEIKKRSNIPTNNITFDYYPNRVFDKEIEYYVFYSEKEKIKGVIDKFKKHKIAVKFIDVKEMISLALYKNLYADDRNVKCFIDIGFINSKIVFSKEDRLIFVRNTNFGCEHIFELLKNASETDNMLELFKYKGIYENKIEELLKDYFSEIFYDIIRTVNFFTTTYRENPPPNILYSGGIFSFPGIYEYFCQNLPYTCILNNVLQLVDYKEEDIKKLGYMFNYAVGVALR